MLLRNGGNKCFKVDVTADMVLLIQYTSPDLKTNNDREDRGAMTGSDGDEEAEERTKPIYDHRRTKVCRCRYGLLFLIARSSAPHDD